MSASAQNFQHSVKAEPQSSLEPLRSAPSRSTSGSWLDPISLLDDEDDLQINIRSSLGPGLTNGAAYHRPNSTGEAQPGMSETRMTSSEAALSSSTPVLKPGIAGFSDKLGAAMDAANLLSPPAFRLFSTQPLDATEEALASIPREPSSSNAPRLLLRRDGSTSAVSPPTLVKDPSSSSSSDSSAKKRASEAEEIDHRPTKEPKRHPNASGTEGSSKPTEGASSRITILRFTHPEKAFTEYAEKRIAWFPSGAVAQDHAVGPSAPQKFLSWYPMPKEAWNIIHKMHRFSPKALNSYGIGRMVYESPQQTIWRKNDNRISKYVVESTGEIVEVNFYSLSFSVHEWFRKRWVLVARGPQTEGALLYFDNGRHGSTASKYRMFRFEDKIPGERDDDPIVGRYFLEPKKNTLSQRPHPRSPSNSKASPVDLRRGETRQGMGTRNTGPTRFSDRHKESFKASARTSEPNDVNSRPKRRAAERMSQTKHSPASKATSNNLPSPPGTTPPSVAAPAETRSWSSKSREAESEDRHGARPVLASGTGASRHPPHILPNPIGYSSNDPDSTRRTARNSSRGDRKNSTVPSIHRTTATPADSPSNSSQTSNLRDPTPPHRFTPRDHPEFLDYMLSHTHFIFHPSSNQTPERKLFSKCTTLRNLLRQALASRLIDRDAYKEDDCCLQLEIQGSGIEYVPGNDEERFEAVKRAIEKSANWGLDWDTGEGGVCGEVEVSVSVL
ncbi:MAG: hypothetical protein Q9227_001775 [Pyrenula ochraceoflavens]